MTRIRLDPETRKNQMLDAGVKIAKRHGIKGLTRVAIAAETGTTDGLVNRYFGNRVTLRAEIIAEAVTRKEPKIIAAALREGFDVPAMPRQLLRDAKALAAA